MIKTSFFQGLYAQTGLQLKVQGQYFKVLEIFFCGVSPRDFQPQSITTFDNDMETNLRRRVESQPIVTTRRLYGLQYSLRISRLQRI